MKSNGKIKVFSISVLCAAIMAGCGGGDASFIGTPNKPGTTGGNGSNNTAVQPPSAPEINVANATEISGKAVPGSQVKVGIYDAKTGSLTDVKEVTADALGKWRIPTTEVNWDNRAIIAAKATKQKQSSPIGTPHLLDTDIPDPRDVRVKALLQDKLSGTAPVDTTLQIDFDNDGVIDATIETDGHGNWETTLPQGSSADKITIRVADLSGNVSKKQSFDLPSYQQLEAPVIKQANATSVNGTATPGSNVRVGVYDSKTGKLIDTKDVKADAFGKWQISSDMWSDGVTLKAETYNGSVVSKQSSPFALDKAIPIVDKVKFKALVGDQNTLSGTAPTGTILKLDIDNDGVTDMVVEPDEFGNWQVALGAGASSERITVKLEDTAGNSSVPVSKNLPIKNKAGGNQDDPTLPGGGEPDPTINKFLTTDTAELGQQNSPIVTSLRYGGTFHGAVKFNQPGIVSEVCRYGVGKCISPRFKEALEDANDQVDEAQKKLNANRENLNALSGSDAPDKDKQIDDAKREIERAEAALKNEKDKLKALQKALPKQDEVVIRDINNVILKTVSSGTIDLQNLKSSLGGNYLIFQDAGIVNIDQKREDGNLRDYGGSIGREFNGVLLFSDPLNEHFVDAYFRDPAAAGWSYQTFGAFSNIELNFNRDLNIGYQSFGQQTPATSLPKNGKATYTGLSHAYYNQNQVTSHNAVVVDFSDKSLTYKTTDTPVLHTFESGRHVIEEKPDYTISGKATWERTNTFKGSVTTNAGLTGKIEGQFYGPNAQEVGGVYGLKGKDAAGDVHYVGGFGAKR